ncbi:MAG: hypothetical protein AB8B55_23010 [Mariniblastus sp.]
MKEIKNAVCPGCTLLCDDIAYSGNSPETNVIAGNACGAGQTFFELQSKQKSSHCVSGKQAGRDAAVKAAVDILLSSNAPLICGLDHLTTEAQQVAWKIADRLGATIDTTMSNHGRSSMFSLQRVGKVTATIGEIANRSDVVVFWFCDPEETHPRLLERLGVGKKIVVIGEVNLKCGDAFYRISKNAAADLIAVLRSIIGQKKYDPASAQKATGLTVSQMEQIAGLLVQSKYGAMFYGQTTVDSSFDLANDSLASMFRELNNHTRFVGMKLRLDGNAQSAENVLAWSSGYPFAVSHSQTFPRYNQVEYSAETLLLRKECDAVLFATGPDLQTAFAALSRSGKDHLGSIPKISISPISNFPSDVSFEVGTPGVSESGEFCRNDDVPIPVGVVNDNELDSAEVVLGEIWDAISLELN